MFTLRGKHVAGSPMQESQPPMWSVYVATDDADAAAARVTEAGGNVLFGPIDVMDAGRMAVFAHPAGGMIGTWQAGSHTGAELVNEPGALNWNELQTRDVEGAKAYYAAVFGWEPDDQDFGGMTYTMFNVGDTGVAGAMPTPSGVPDEVPAFWLTYFTVEDCDASVAKVQELGGARWSPHTDGGRGALRGRRRSARRDLRRHRGRAAGGIVTPARAPDVDSCHGAPGGLARAVLDCVQGLAQRDGAARRAAPPRRGQRRVRQALGYARDELIGRPVYESSRAARC